ncbi:MAG TPA: hypothetical protein VFP84_03360 [Kofleriaceae bacterium]|nr:hypothetical protein [Kofleriaceae bacterium]
MLTSLCLVLGLGAAVTAHADVTPIGTVFDTVDGITMQTNGFFLDGVIHGDAAPTHLFVPTGSSTDGFIANCQRLALLMITKPGKYQLSVRPGVAQCQLIVRTP